MKTKMGKEEKRRNKKARKEKKVKMKMSGKGERWENPQFLLEYSLRVLYYITVVFVHTERGAG